MRRVIPTEIGRGALRKLSEIVSPNGTPITQSSLRIVNYLADEGAVCPDSAIHFRRINRDLQITSASITTESLSFDRIVKRKGGLVYLHPKMAEALNVGPVLAS